MHAGTQAFGIGKGDEVIVTPNTFIATSLVILKEGAKPVYADINPITFNIDPKKIENKINPKTKAIDVVHYAEQMCDWVSSCQTFK
jgi:perosamine synthetase